MIRVAKLPMRQVAHALEVDETCGFLKAVVDRCTSRAQAPLHYYGTNGSLLMIAAPSSGR